MGICRVSPKSYYSNSLRHQACLGRRNSAIAKTKAFLQIQQTLLVRSIDLPSSPENQVGVLYLILGRASKRSTHAQYTFHVAKKHGPNVDPSKAAGCCLVQLEPRRGSEP